MVLRLVRLHQEGRRHLPDDDAQEGRYRSQTDDRGTLAQREPVGSHLGAGVQEQRLGDGDADGADQGGGVAIRPDAAHHAEDAHQDGAQPHSLLEAPGVDRPGSRDRQRDIDVHEEHCQQGDLQVGDAVLRGCQPGDRRVADPEDLHRQADEHEGQQHHPAVAIDFDLLRCSGNGHDGLLRDRE